jgi:5-formyltetrahydrofolate cyclo-ligase
MKAILTSDDTDFSANKLGIIEPQNGMEILPDEMDLILVPMLICDKAGHRVGYGKGFYDRFLQLCRKDALKVAFSYFEPVDKIEDTSSFDVSLNLCITPQFIYEFE